MTRGIVTIGLALRGVTTAVYEARGAVCHPGDATVVQRDVPRWLVLRCPCGCGEDVMVNLDPRQGPAWRLYEDDGALSLYPSVWRDSGCGSHFIVRLGRIHLFTGSWDDDDQFEIADAATLRELANVATVTPRSFVDLADETGLDPWTALVGCRALAQASVLVEGTRHLRGWFCLADEGRSVRRRRDT